MPLSELIRSAREGLEGKDLTRLVLDAQRGDNSARDELILGNLWLVELVIRPDEFCQKEDLATILREALDALDPVDRRIVEIVYGLGDRPRARTLGQAARMLRLEPVKAKEFMTRAMESLKQMFCAL